MQIEINTKNTKLRINTDRITVTVDEFAEEFFTIVERPKYLVTVYRHGKFVDDVKPLLKFGDLETYATRREEKTTR